MASSEEHGVMGLSWAILGGNKVFPYEDEKETIITQQKRIS